MCENGDNISVQKGSWMPRNGKYIGDFDIKMKDSIEFKRYGK
jgi:hypothetical protein